MTTLPPAGAPRRALHQQFVRLLLLPLIAAFAVAAFGTLFVSYYSERQQQERARNQVLRIYGQAVTRPLWDCDSATARGIVETLNYLPEVAGVRLQDVCANDVISTGAATDIAGAEADRLQQPIVHVDELGRSFTVGHLDVRFHPLSITSAAIDGLWRYGTIFLAMLSVVLLGAALVFRRIIGQPLARFLAAIHAQQPIGAHAQAPGGRVAPGRNDELSDVMHAYDDLMAANERQHRALAEAIDQLRSNEKQLMHTARHDPLTGLGNRLVLEEALDRAVARAQRTGGVGHVLLLDLNQFKPVNDTHGHAVGDQVLVKVARRLTGSVRRTDTVARLGGDEFVVVVEDQESAADLPALAHKIMAAIARPMHLGDLELQVSASLGAASFPEDGTTSMDLLARADQAMYATKPSGSRFAQLDPLT